MKLTSSIQSVEIINYDANGDAHDFERTVSMMF